MHILRLPLKTTKYAEQILERRFHMISHLHNVMVRQAKERLIRLKYDREYALAKKRVRRTAEKDQTRQG